MYSYIKLGYILFGERDNKIFDNVNDVFKPEESTPDKDFIIFRKANYVKQDLDISIRLQIDPSKYAAFSNLQINDLNYCSIENYKDNYDDLSQRQGAYYYFIRSIEWVSNSVSVIHLHMDVLNSFHPEKSLDGRTHVLREHRDRFEIESAVLHDRDITIKRKIDTNVEGFSFPKYRRSKSNLDLGGIEYNKKFYLMYMSQNDVSDTINNPVRCFLVPSEKISLVPGGVTNPPVVLEPKNLAEGRYYYLTYEDNPNGRFGLTGDEITMEPHVIWRLWREGNYISRVKMQYDSNNSFVAEAPKSQHVQLTFEIMKEFKVLNYSTNNYDAISNSSITEGINAGTAADLYWKPIDEIDKTDPRIIKIIMLPYSPFEVSLIQGHLVIPIGWKVNKQMQLVELENLSQEFERKIKFSEHVNQPFARLNTNVPLYRDRDSKKLNYNEDEAIEPESKLFSSEFYSPTINYDSFKIAFDLEKMTKPLPPDFISDDINVTYKATNTINSRFLFDFTDYKDDYTFTREGGNLYEQDYPSILYINRNNEVTLYNNSYINYIKNGFNYDVKSKNRQELSSALGVGLNLAGTIASLISAPATGGLSLVGAVGMGTATVSSLVGAINNKAQLEQNFEQKQKELQMQSTAISGADDVDLMKYYSLNKLQASIYKIKKENKNLLKGLFHFYGYKCDYYGVPNIRSRKYFNFLQAEITPSQLHASGYTEEVKDEIIAKFKEGITFMHKVSYFGKNYYDENQEFENWETSLDNVG